MPTDEHVLTISLTLSGNDWPAALTAAITAARAEAREQGWRILTGQVVTRVFEGYCRYAYVMTVAREPEQLTILGPMNFVSEKG
jgi:hypothetical protein